MGVKRRRIRAAKPIESALDLPAAARLVFTRMNSTALQVRMLVVVVVSGDAGGACRA